MPTNAPSAPAANSHADHPIRSPSPNAGPEGFVATKMHAPTRLPPIATVATARDADHRPTKLATAAAVVNTTAINAPANSALPTGANALDTD